MEQAPCHSKIVLGPGNILSHDNVHQVMFPKDKLLDGAAGEGLGFEFVLLRVLVGQIALKLESDDQIVIIALHPGCQLHVNGWRDHAMHLDLVLLQALGLLLGGHGST